MFTADDIHTRLRERPFVPLRIITSSGQAYDITHPDLVLIGRRSLIVGTASTENPAHFDSANRIAILHISDLQVIAPSAAKTGDTNGQP